MQAAAFELASPLVGPQIFGIPVDREILFSNHKDIYKKRVEKRQRKFIVKTSFIKLFLKRGEKILLVTTGYSPLSSLAQYLTGFVFIYLKRSMFIFTNYRIFHVPTTSSYKYKYSIAQITYSGCKSIVLKGGTLFVQYPKFGKIERFKGIALSERKKIKSLFKKNVPLSATSDRLAARTHLCPRCTHRLEEGKYTCEKCQLQFKRKCTAALLSIFFPGGGYFYTGHYLVGSLNAVLELFLMVFSAFILFDIFHRIQVNLTYLVLIPLIFLFLKIAVVVHSSHFIDEFIPKAKEIKPLLIPRKHQGAEG